MGGAASDGGETVRRVGIWGNHGERLVSSLNDPDGVLRYESVRSLGDESVTALECLVITVDSDSRYRERLSARVEDQYPEIPVLFVMIGDVDSADDIAVSSSKQEDILVVGESIPTRAINRRCHRLVRDQGSGGQSRSIQWADPHLLTLWGLAVLTYGIGDFVTTIWAVLTHPGIIEANPIVAALLETYGVLGFLALKGLVFFILILVSALAVAENRRYGALWPPIVASMIGILLTGWNIVTIITTI